MRPRGGGGGLAVGARAGVVATAGPVRWAIAIVTVAAVLPGLVGVLPGAPAPAGAPPAAAAASAVGGPCNTSLPAVPVTGTLSIEGGPADSASGFAQTEVRYSVVVGYSTGGGDDGGPTASGCEAVAENLSTTSNGSFSFVPSAPASSCGTVDGAYACTNYTGPYGPLRFSSVAPGYGLAVGGTAAHVALDLVYQFASVTITPSGPTVTLSTDAPVDLSAVAWAANGTMSGLAPTFSWVVNGSGWSFVGSDTSAVAILEGDAAPTPAEVTVTARASDAGTALPPLEAHVALVAVPTVVDAGTSNRSAVDVGLPVEYTVSATGAAGYGYRGYLAPGLGLPAEGLVCRDGPAANGTEPVTCVGSATYAEAGVATPVANVSNGFDTTVWSFPAVAVDPAPAITVNPTAPAGYAGTPVALTVSATDGTGPYVGACLSSGPSGTLCDGGAGPTWAFDPTFPEPGNYTASLSATDADGERAVASVGVEVVAPLAVGAIVPSSENVSVGSAVTLRTTVAGGVAPLRVWWNASSAAGPLLEGTVAGDGPLSVELAPNTTGRWVVTVTVVDRLGSFESSELALTVGPAAAERVVPVATPSGAPATAGVPIALAWAAFDASGGVDPSFEADAALELAGGAGAPEAWANASGVGSLTALGNGTFGVPSAAWVGGSLRVNLTVLAAGPVSVLLAGPGLPGPVAPVNLTVAPDRSHLRLFDPTVARPGSRENATLWRIGDRYGNAVPGALVTIELSFGAARDASVVTAVALPGGGSGVWVNFTAPGPGAGTVTVVDAAGDVLLGPLAVPAAAGPLSVGPTVTTLAAVAPVGAAGIAAAVVARRRRRLRSEGVSERDLQALAEGRARAVELIGRAGAVDLAGLEAAWGEPAPPALADWLASLVADGTVRGTVGTDGRPRFCLAERPPAPRVTVDPEALDRSLRRRDAALGEGDGAPPESLG
jgi:hypothetical protein